jgi:5-methylcytosine-specific restriction endonuclease McrA
MPRRSLADVPNRLVRIFLEAAGRDYDVNRGLAAYSKLTPALIARFDGRCAYCGEAKPLVEEHVVPINRTAVGLHAWGNIVPACKDCNRIKEGDAWETHPQLNDLRRAAIQAYISD